ncbi:MAG: hypothetical protein V4685_08260 [Bacteroidota bacterium]
MKFLIFLNFFLLFAGTAYSQNENKVDSISELLQGDYYIEGPLKGGRWSIKNDTSLLWKRAHDLFRHMPLKSVSNWFDTSKHVLKYYAFLKLLDLNDSLAFVKLEQIGNDSVKVNFSFDDDNWGDEKFNQLLLSMYKQFAQAKYYDGGTVHLGIYYFGPSIRKFPKANSSTWRKKYSEIEEFAKRYNLRPF